MALYIKMNEKLDIIIDRLTIIEERLTTIENKLDNMIEKQTKVEEKMCDHINFIENTYALVRTPLSYIKTKIEYVMGRETTRELPVLNYKE